MKNLITVTLLVLALACNGNRQLEQIPMGPGIAPGVVKNMGYCPDIASEACAVRAFWRNSEQATGTEAYWLLNTNNQVCFVNNHVYTISMIGYTTHCLWRDRRP